MSLSRRGLLSAFMAAPVIIRTSGLLMPIKPRPVESVVTGPAATLATTDEIAIKQRAAYGLVEIASGLSVPLDDYRVTGLPSYYQWLISSPEARAKYWEEPPVAPESWDWSVVESSKALQLEYERLAEARLHARPKPITPSYINLINRREEPFPSGYSPLRPDILKMVYSGRANPFRAA